MMKNESKTLYIPLYGKALVSRKGIILKDKKAEEIWAEEGFSIGGKSRSRWLAYFMGMRAAVIDKWTEEQLRNNPKSLVIHLGCGLDSRAERVNTPYSMWYDVDLPEVTEARKKHFSEKENYKMLGASAMETEWVKNLPAAENAVLILEGVSMYLSETAIKKLFAAFGQKFAEVNIIMDVYTELAVKMSKYKNPIKEVGAKATFGTFEHGIFENEKITFTGELCMTPKDKIEELSGFEKVFFKKMFAGSFAKKLYKIFTYRIK
ncbi:MAG: class I SAM-dependent methyltransferase [Oscillospiraceae bacterium]|nr:class I SAM-dependent methyltransferase [Oscillospiraceae bacterium]